MKPYALSAVSARRAVWLALLALCTAAVHGQPVPPEAAAAPALRVGDRWVFEFQDHMDAARSETRTVQVLRAGSDGSVLQVDGSRSGRAEAHLAPDMSMLKRVLPNGFERVYTPASADYRFPLEVGKSWSGDVSYGLNPNIRVTAKGTHTVERQEVLEVAGKRWNTWVIKTRSTVQLLPGPYGHYEATRWYAPAARIAIQHEERLVLGGQTRERSESRLKELTLQD